MYSVDHAMVETIYNCYIYVNYVCYYATVAHNYRLCATSFCMLIRSLGLPQGW